jgi:hypothetical protein
MKLKGVKVHYLGLYIINEHAILLNIIERERGRKV